jgi:hypothetical protein
MDLTYGYYRYNEKIYVNREDALNDMMMRQDWNGQMTFHYHDEVFEQLDWTVEPPFNIDLLYKMRAQQIRDKYPYVILQLSGGVDSTQILETFLDNNIFIDEIQTFHHHSGTKTLTFDKKSALFKEVSVLYEYQFAVIPLLKWVREVSPNTKIVEVDLMPELIGGTSRRTNGELLGQHPITKGMINPPNIVFNVPRTVTYVSLTHNIKRIEKDGVCIIRGIEKPALRAFKIAEDTYKLYFNFHDQTMGSTKFMASGVMAKTFTLESFFWSPDAPLIPIKQSHLIKKRLENDLRFKRLFVFIKENIHKERIQLLSKSLRHDSPLFQRLERLIYPVIYPSLRNTTWFGLKPLSTSPEKKLLEVLGINNYHDDMKDEYNRHKLKMYEPIINKEQMIDYMRTRRYHIGNF